MEYNTILDSKLFNDFYDPFILPLYVYLGYKKYTMRKLTIILLLSIQLLVAQQPVNGLKNIGTNFGQGGDIIENTCINIHGYNYSILNDSIAFNMGPANLYGLNFPFYGLKYGKGYFGRLDLRSVGYADQWTVSYIDSIHQNSNGLNVRKEQFSLSIYDNVNIPSRYEYGFTGYPTNSDHFCFDRILDLDITLLKAHKDYARIQHYFNTDAGHYTEIMVNNKIYLQTDLDTALIASGKDVILPNKGTSFAYFNNSTLVSSNSVKGSTIQVGALTSGVTLNKPLGTIKTVSSNLAAGASAIFTITNSYVNPNSIITLTVHSSTTGTPYIYVYSIGAGSFNVRICNINAVQTFNAPLNISYIIN